MRWFILLVCSVPLTESAVISPDIGVLCPREDVTLTCSTADENDTAMEWGYNGIRIGLFVNSQQPGQTLNIMESGFQFSLHLIATNPTLSSNMSFTADVAMNGHNVSCFTADNGGGVSASHKMIRVGDISIPSVNGLRVSGITNDSESATVTIEWDPPSQGGSPVNYSITSTPTPISVSPPVTTSTSTTITLHYNTNYTITLTSSNCVGQDTDNIQFTLVNCSLPSMADNTVIFPFPSTTEGSVVMFACEFGFRPQDVLSSVCGSNGEWQPDPGLHDCTEVVCGDPSSPVNGHLGTPSGSGLGSTVSFQCSEGFSPPWVMNSTCNINGTWSPNPGELICTASTSSEDSNGISTSREGGDGVSTTTSTTTTVVTGSEIPENQGGGSIGVVVGVVVAVIFILTVILMIVIMVCIMMKRRNISMNAILRWKLWGPSGESGESRVPSEEYSTISHDGKNRYARSPQVYSSLQHNLPQNNHKVTANGEEYSVLSSQTNTATILDGMEYSVIGNKQTHGTASASKDLVYADVGSHPKKKTSVPKSPPVLTEPKIIYSAITGTLSPITSEKSTNQESIFTADGTLDLNMLLIQISEVTPHWYRYGEALGVSPKILEEVRGLQLKDYDKFVEVLDNYLNVHSRDPPPSWKEIAKALKVIGYEKLAADILMVYTTGKLPIEVDDSIPSKHVQSPPPLPPKTEDLMLHSSSNENKPPPIPRKSNLLLPAVPARPPKNLSPIAPPRPPKTHV